MNSPAAAIPLVLAQNADFASARNFFARIGFDEPSLCRRLKMDDMSDLGKVEWEKLAGPDIPPELWAALEIFIQGITVAEARLRDLWGEPALAALQALGLVRPFRKAPGEMICPVWLYPVQGFLIVSDRRNDPEAENFAPSEDIVFPGIYAGTLRFLSLFPDAKGGEALDLCGGSGIGALLLARTAKLAVTADLTERSAFFAEFNGRLNGVPIQSLCGDLYQPVRGREFDLITAHPPFVPSTGKTMIYRDAGAAGEDISRGVIAGLAEHLRPGGTCMVLCVACDTQEAPFEKRAFDWLGEKKSEFDVIYGLQKVLTVEGVVASMAQRGQRLSAPEAEDLLNRLRSLGARQFVYGALFIRRLRSGTAPAPFRFRISPAATAADFERIFAWRRWAVQPNLADRLAAARPQLSRGTELNVRHVVADGELVPAEFTFSIDAALLARFRPDGWVVPLIAELNGQRTVRQVFEKFSKAGELPEGFALADFTGLIRQMIEAGLLEIDEASSHQQA